jgi:hypothetical protein
MVLWTQQQGILILIKKKNVMGLQENYRRFAIEPSTDEERALKGTITLQPKSDVPLDDKTRDSLTLCFNFEIPTEKVKDFW